MSSSVEKQTTKVAPKDEELSLGGGYFVNYHAPKFGVYDVKDEYLHPEYKKTVKHYALTETQYFGFYVPEVQLHCFTWVWYHTNLDSVLAGTMAWRGVKEISLGCELFNFHAHMSGQVFEDHWPNAKFENGLTIKMLDPGRQFMLTYHDPKHNNHFEVLQEAVSEIMIWPSNKHFEQVMKCSGEITLRGKKHKVDCLSVRDRSWGEARLEDSMPIPPNSWITAAFSRDFAFHVTGMDHPDLNPVWKPHFEVDAKSVLRFGWMVVDGKRVAIKSMKKRIDYDRRTILPTAISIEITDAEERQYRAEGRVLASTPLSSWLNTRAVICLVEWHCNGKIGYGEIQNVQFTDFIRSMSEGA